MQNPEMLLRVLLFTRKLAAVLIALISVSLLFVPFYEVFAPGEEILPHAEDYWHTVYIWGDIFLVLLFVPYFTCWILYIRLKKPKLRKILSAILVGFSVLQLYFLFGMSMAVQDFDASYGLLLSFFLAVLTICYFIINRIVYRKLKQPGLVNDIFTY